MNLQQAKSAWRAQRGIFEQGGAYFPQVQAYLPSAFKHDYKLAMDAQPQLQTDPNAGIPALLTTMIDPEVFKILFAKNQAAEIFGEVRKGTWVDDTALFPTIEYTGEVTSYGDFDRNGSTGANADFPNRQSYLFQTIVQYGQRELERAGLARLNWVSELNAAAALTLSKFQNLTYFYGVAGLENYGLLNDPNLSAAITPSLKAATGTGAWFNASGQQVATPNEVYNDIKSLIYLLVQQSQGLVDSKSVMTLAMSPESAQALTGANTFNVNVEDLMKKNYPNLTVKTAVQYGVLTPSNQQGIAAGNWMQLIADNVEGQKAGYCAFNEKMRAHQIIRDLSSFMQKLTGGTWGAIIRQPFAITNMVGI